MNETEQRLAEWLLSKSETIDSEASALYSETVSLGIVMGWMGLLAGLAAFVACTGLCIWCIRREIRNEREGYLMFPAFGFGALAFGGLACLGLGLLVASASDLATATYAPRLYVIQQLTD